MASFFDNIKQRIQQGDMLVKLIAINVVVFIVIGGVSVFGTLFKIEAFNLQNYVGVPAQLPELLIKPWTLLTYMFVHANLLHLFFNMLMLYWFGRLFLNYFIPKNLLALYLIGGLGGALLYIIAFNTIPYYVDMNASVMVGASASVTAVIFASAFYKPNQEVMLLFLGRVKIIYIALFIFVLDFLALASPENPGGHIAHIGGAIVGYAYAKQFAQGNDITRWLNNLIDKCVDLFKPKKQTRMKVKYSNRTETDYEYNERKKRETENIDTILDKIKASGYSSLSKEEKKQLFDASKK